MRVFISTDMKSITGIATPPLENVVRGQPGYEHGRELMHGDVNAAIRGAFDAGTTDVLVNNSHSSMQNIDAAHLNDRARLIRGNTKTR